MLWDLDSAWELSSIVSPGPGGLGQASVNPPRSPGADPQLGGDLRPAPARLAQFAHPVAAAHLPWPVHVLARHPRSDLTGFDGLRSLGFFISAYHA